MRETEFYIRQAKKIYAYMSIKKEYLKDGSFTMKPVEIKDRAYQGSWDKCRGFVDKAKPNSYCVEFSHSEQAGNRKYYFTQEQAENLFLLFNPWLDDPILNKSGLAQKVYPDAKGNSLRRRMEQKGDRGTFSDEEKKRIIEVLENYLKEVKESLNF